MRKGKLRRGLWLASCLAAIVMLAGASQTAQAVPVYGVTTSNQLVRFDSVTTTTINISFPITGLQAGEQILGIDFRPANGQLYGLGSTGRIYLINTTTGAATQAGANPLSPALNGTAFGFDFNPVPDRLRVNSDADQNLRINPADGVAVVDGTLAFMAGDVNAGQNPNVVGAGYTNNFNGAATTTLYDIDSNLDILVTQNPANNGTLQTVGPLGVNTTELVGFDIITSGVTNTAYAALNLSGDTVSKFYTINLTTGAATLSGTIGGAQIRAIAVAPAPVTSQRGYALTNTNRLLRFNTASPGMNQSAVAIGGLNVGDTVLGIDFRPATGQLYGMVRDLAGTGYRLVIINPTTGATTAVAPIIPAPAGSTFGFDFNPVPDRLRVNSDADQNLRINPADGVAAVDGTIAFMAGDVNAAQNPNIAGAAYLNSFTGTAATTLYDIDSNLDILATQNPANNGTLQTVGALGVDTTGAVGFDIGSANTALAALTTATDNISRLYTINLATGRATLVGNFGGLVNDGVSEQVIGLAIGGNDAVVDYDGDGRTDYAVFRLSNNFNYVLLNGTGGTIFQEFGFAGQDILTPGDYDGDGRTDFAVYRDSVGTFFVLKSSTNTLQSQPFGLAGDEPVARDYDGDNRTDFAIVRRTGGQLIWYILNSANGAVSGQQFGLDTDVVAPGDYDGDGRFDLAVQRSSGGQSLFYINQSTAGFRGEQFGLAGDLNVPGDYDGDGRTDIAVYRAGSTSFWYIRQSSDNSFRAVQFGTKSDFTTQGDYDGDGKTDVAVYRPSAGTFFVNQSTNGLAFTVRWGTNGDYPVANFDTH